MRRYPGDLCAVSVTLVIVSLVSFFLIRGLVGGSYQLIPASESVFLIAGLSIALIGGARGSLAFIVIVPVTILAYAEEVFVNGPLIWLGLVLAFFGLVMLPTIGLVFRNRGADLSAALEISALVFTTRLVLAPFPVNLLQSPVIIPIIYTLILSALVGYIWIRRIPFAELGLTKGSGRMPAQISLGLVCGAVLAYVELKVLRPPAIVIGPSFVTNVVYVVITMLAFVALTEELLYRGLIQVRLARIMPKWQAIHITAMLFALFHIGWFNPLEVIFAYAAGVVFGYLMFRYNSLAAPVTAHGFGNIILYLFALVR